MRRISFIVSILGIFILVGLIYWMPYKGIKGVNDFNKTVSNEKVFLSGFVKNERRYSGKSVFELNGVKIVCEMCKSLKGKDVMIEGIVNEYNGNKKVYILKIGILN